MIDSCFAVLRTEEVPFTATTSAAISSEPLLRVFKKVLDAVLSNEKLRKSPLVPPTYRNFKLLKVSSTLPGPQSHK